MRAVLVPCGDCRLPAGYRDHGNGFGQQNQKISTGEKCPRCADVGVLIDVCMPVLERQIIDAWWAEPEWHRLARWRAEAAGRRGFFQPQPSL